MKKMKKRAAIAMGLAMGKSMQRITNVVCDR